MARHGDLDVWIWDAGSNLHRMSVEMIHSRVSRRATQFWLPKADVFETATDFVVRIDLAGVTIEDVDLEYHPQPNVLRVRGTRTEPTVGCGDRIGIYQLEVPYGAFEREIRIPEGNVVKEEIQAELKDGVLNVRLPKGS